MSRLGKKTIIVPDKTEVSIDDGKVDIKGPKGELSRVFDSVIKIEKTEEGLKLTPNKKNVSTLMLWGTYASHLKNMIDGVNEGFSKKLLIEGVGYKAEVRDKTLVLSLGFSHPVEMRIPEQIEIKVEKNAIQISGIDKELVGQTAARIRSFKKPEPYKGKGIRYEGEVVRRKAGKKAVGGA